MFIIFILIGIIGKDIFNVFVLIINLNIIFIFFFLENGLYGNLQFIILVSVKQKYVIRLCWFYVFVWKKIKIYNVIVFDFSCFVFINVKNLMMNNQCIV